MTTPLFITLAVDLKMFHFKRQNKTLVQGSMLGPLLFLIKINDLPGSVKSQTILYADVTTFLSSNSDMDNLANIAKEIFMQASNLFQLNGLLLNQDKNQNIVFSPRHKNTKFQDNLSKTVKFLEICIDDEFTWTPDIDYLST